MPYINAGGFIGFGSYPLAGSPLCFAFPSLFFLFDRALQG